MSLKAPFPLTLLPIESIQFNALCGCLSGAIIISDAMMSVPTTRFITINNNDLTVNARCLRAFFCLSSGVSAKHHTQNVSRLFGRKCEDAAIQVNGHIAHFLPIHMAVCWRVKPLQIITPCGIKLLYHFI